MPEPPEGKYNSKSELSVEVRPDGPREFDFQLHDNL